MTRTARTWLIVTIVVVVLGIGAVLAYPFVYRAFFAPTVSNTAFNAPSSPTAPPGTPPDSAPDTAVLLKKLDIPWAVGQLPDARMLITERPGKLLLLDPSGGAAATPIEVSGVHHEGEGGLLGLAIHPDFAKNQQIYLYLTTVAGNGLRNRVERYVLDEKTAVLSLRKVILDDIPGAAIHDGGRMGFGPDGKLYIGTGDAGDNTNAQDKTSLAGKILRLNDDGTVPSDNPFDSPIWTYGHRNVQGFTWDDQGRMWATEHGPSGSPPESGQDELNLIEKGVNYGWPVITGDKTQTGMRTSIINSGVNDTWAPSGATFYNGSIFFAGLRGQAVYQATLKEHAGARPTVSLKAHFKEEFGRLRTVLVGQDGFFYVLTNNTDGRGTPKPGDDKLIRIHPRVFQR